MNCIYRARPQQHVFRKRLFSRITRSAILCGLGGTDAWVSGESSLSHRSLQLTRLSPQTKTVGRLFSILQTHTEQEMTLHALQIVSKAIQAVDPAQAIRSHFQLDGTRLKIGQKETLNLENYDNLVLVAFGKASSAMAAAVLQQLDGRLKSSGIVICKDDHGTKEELQLLKKNGVEVKMASHPVPDERSVQGAASLMDLVRTHRSPSTLVVCCISGGGSALFCLPTSPLSLEDLQAVNSVLLASGMGIQDMNVIRKRLEQGKGGGLAAECYPSQLVTLVLSDVLGDPLDLIASGPTVPDSSTWMDAWNIVQQYDLQDRLPKTVVSVMECGLRGGLPNSPSIGHPIFETSKTVLVGNNAIAVKAAAKEAQALGYHPVVLGTQIEGEAKEIPHVYTAMALQLQQLSVQSFSGEFSVASALPVALIAGGEATVSLSSDSKGKGGRNQEMALSAGLLLEKLDLRNVVFASLGTDGTDGPTDAAGAVVDATTVRHDMEGGRDALRTHNAYPFFERLGQMDVYHSRPSPLIKTGPTGTNVADICITLIESPP